MNGIRRWDCLDSTVGFDVISSRTTYDRKKPSQPVASAKWAIGLVVRPWLLANKAPQSIFLIEIHWEQAILERLWIEAAFCVVDLTSRIASVALVGRAPHS